MRIIFAFAACWSLLSCNSDFLSDDDSFTEKSNWEELADYLMLRPGNYWVFESHVVEMETDRVFPLNKSDSLFVAKDTLIGHLQYAVLRGTRLGESYQAVLRSSGGDLVDASGNLLLSLDQLGDTIQMPEALLPPGAISGTLAAYRVPAISVPFGTFDAIAIARLYTLATDPASNIADNSLRQEMAYYARGIGLIQYSSHLRDHPNRIEMRLARCRLQ